jgi:hypothetical protein
MSFWIGVGLVFLGATFGFFTAALLSINRLESDYEDRHAEDRRP